MSYVPHDWSQAIALGHLLWGALFAALFGHTFTVLTVSNMVSSLACLLVFYLLLRQLGITPANALLGTAVLGLNPLYIYLTYSYMTDITFLMYLLVACLCYIRGMQGYGERWLWLGSATAALAYMTRQHGLLIIVAALAYLLWSRRWSWRGALAICLLPALVIASYAAWDYFQPSPLVDLLLHQEDTTILASIGSFFNTRAFHLTWMLSSLGLSLLSLTRRPRHLLIALPLFAFMVYYQIQSAMLFGSLWPRNGNIIDFTGYVMFSYGAQAVWGQWLWSVLGVLGGAAFGLNFAFYIERTWAWLRARPWCHSGTDHAQGPAIMLYILGFMLAGIIVVLTPFLFDRYWLALFPILCVPALRYAGRKSPDAINQPDMTPVRSTMRLLRLPVRSYLLSWVLLMPLALFSLVAMRDYKEHAALRWRAAEQLVSQGARPDQIRAGFEWENFYSFKAGVRYIRDTHDFTHLGYPPEAVIDPVYVVSDLPVPGYTEIGSIPYSSWLDGGVIRRVLLLKRS